MTNDYRAKVADADEREEAGRLYVAYAKAEIAADNGGDVAAEFSAEATPIQDRCADEMDAARAKFEAERLEILARRDAAIAALEDKSTPPERKAAREALKIARDAFENHPGGGVMTDDDDQPRRCLLSGVVLYDDDETIHDEATGGFILRHLILPPVETEGDEEEAA